MSELEGRAHPGTDRRGFLRTAASLGLAMAAGRRLPDAWGATPAVPHRVVPGDSLVEATVDDLQRAMTADSLSAQALVEAYQARIAALDHAGPSLQSILELNPDALDIAAALDAERARRGPRGPLHGIPVLLKDNIDTGDHQHTTAGSLALLDAPPPRDAVIVQRLRDAGAIILGKTNLSEWAGMRSGHGISGWSARGGFTKNPYALDRSPGGSSSGTGAAIAASLATLGIGTETDGSLVGPSSANGLVGVKPTVGRWSRTGLIPIASSFDTPGPMCRTVRDAALLFAILAAPDRADAATLGQPRIEPGALVASLDTGALRGARLGVVREFFTADSHAELVVDAALDALRRAGAVLVDPVSTMPLDTLDAAKLPVLLFEFRAQIAAYLRKRGGAHTPRTLSDLIQFNIQHRDVELRWFGQELFEAADSPRRPTAEQYRSALDKSHLLSRTLGVDMTMTKYSLDALVTITAGPAWVTDVVVGDALTEASSTLAAVAGYPNITVPAGEVFGLPVGVSFIGTAWSEPKLLRYAYAFEQATNARRPPTFRPTAKLDV